MDGLAPAVADAEDRRSSVPGTTWWVELGAAAAVALAYLSSPRRTPSAALVAEAEANGRALWDLEQRLGLDVEPALQDAALQLGVPGAMNWLYGTLHFVVTAVTLVLLFRRHPGRYQCWRAGFVASSLLAFGVYRLWPVAPPRLLPDGGGSTVLADTLALHPTPWDFQSGPLSEVANHYAAMPSMHAGWALFCALALGLGRSKRTRVALLGYPMLTTVVIMATGNHFVLDALAGFAVVGLGMGAAAVGEQWVLRRAGRSGAEVRSASAAARPDQGGSGAGFAGAARGAGLLHAGRSLGDAA